MAKNKQKLQNRDWVNVLLIVAMVTTNLFWFVQFSSQKSINENHALTIFNQQVEIIDLKLCVNKNLKNCKYNPPAQ